MKKYPIVCLVAILSTASCYYLEDFDVNLEKQWDSFKLNYGRVFIRKDVEDSRKEIFKTNFKNILIHNIRYSRGQESYKMDINRFSDMTLEEFRKTMLSLRIPKSLRKNGITHLSPLSLSDLPAEVDHRKNGLVTQIQDQGGCGSCWAFSAIGSIEGQHARKTGNLVPLSAQNLVDCSTDYGNIGCNGGLMDYAFDYVLANGGIATEESYPYVAYDQKCDYTKEGIGATITGYVDIKDDEKKLTEAVANIGPVSVGINAGEVSFHRYKSGIYEDPNCTTRLNHGVLLVGYGSEDGKDYWIIKNSWGDKWGEDGYMRIIRNKNHCGMAKWASYPTV